MRNLLCLSLSLVIYMNYRESSKNTTLETYKTKSFNCLKYTNIQFQAGIKNIVFTVIEAVNNSALRL